MGLSKLIGTSVDSSLLDFFFVGFFVGATLGATFFCGASFFSVVLVLDLPPFFIKSKIQGHR